MKTHAPAKKIPLTQGKYALVDAEDFDRINKFKWCLSSTQGRWFYASAWKRIPGGKRERIKMHRVVLMAKAGQIVDHINHDTLDNRKENLRICSGGQNSQNSEKKTIGTSKYKGVCFHKRIGKFQAYIYFNKQRFHIGSFADEKKAARAYDKAALSMFEQFAFLNKSQFPEDFRK